MKIQLDGGLVLQSLDEVPAEERPTLSAFYATTFDDDDAYMIGNWAADLMTNHPTCKPEYIFVVIDPELSAPAEKGGSIVSALLIIPQTWTYSGEIPLKAARVEIVATHPDYRGRGLIRQLMKVAHDLCDALGCHMTFITGIPTYYRMFGYAMAVDLGTGIVLPVHRIPKGKAPEGEESYTPAYTLRAATDADAETLHQLDVYRAKQSPISHIRTPELWCYEMNGRGDMPFRIDLQMIVDKNGEVVGYIAPRFNDIEHIVQIYSWVVGEKASYVATYADTLRGLKALLDARYSDQPDKYPKDVYIDAGAHDALYELVDGLMGRISPRMYAFYVRVPDYEHFFKQIAPVLERRLVNSGANCYTGTLTVSFRNLHGVTLTFEAGKLVNVEEKKLKQWDGEAGFPYDMFLSLVFGHHTYKEIQPILPDTMSTPEARVLFDALFPKQRAWIYPLP